MKNHMKHFCFIDPRTKILLLFLCVGISLIAPSIKYELFLVVIIALFGLYQQVIRYTVISFVIYLIVYALTLCILTCQSEFQIALTAFFGLVHKVYPCGMISGIIISTTHVGEFLTAMYKMHIPQKIIIPLTVMLRYLPAIKKDLGYIKDAMHLRDISPTWKGFLKNPLLTMECIYVPLMMRASLTADELTIAAITRGIENPVKRTSLIHLGFHIQDGCVILIFIIIACLTWISGVYL